MGNETANNPDLSETELRGLKVKELRDRAHEEGVASRSTKRKEELVDAISEAHRNGAASDATDVSDAAGERGDAGPGSVRGGHRARRPPRRAASTSAATPTGCAG